MYMNNNVIHNNGVKLSHFLFIFNLHLKLAQYKISYVKVFVHYSHQHVHDINAHLKLKSSCVRVYTRNETDKVNISGTVFY